MALKDEMKQQQRRRFTGLLVILVVLALTALALPRFQYIDLNHYQVGTRAPNTIQTPVRIYTPDKITTKRAQQRARQAVVPVFMHRQPSVSDELTEALKKHDGIAATDRTHSMARTVLGFFHERGLVLKKALQQVKAAKQIGLHDLKTSNTTALKRSEFEQRVVRLSELRSKTEHLLQDLYPDFTSKAALVDIIASSARPNVTLNYEQYQQVLQTAEQDVKTRYLQAEKGSIIVRQGEKITPTVRRLLKALNGQFFGTQLHYGVAGLLFALFGIVCIGGYYRQSFEKPSIKKLIIMTSTTLLFAVMAKIMAWLNPTLPPGSEYGFPFASAIMVLVIFVGEIPAALVGFLLAIYLMIVLSSTLSLFLVFVFGGLVALFFAREIERRSTVLYCGLFVGAFQLVALSGALLINPGPLFAFENAARFIWAGSGGVIIVPFVTLGLIPFYENIFDVTTTFRLLELADMNHPALQELFEKAPGTFQHSLTLSNICEQAARSIDADALRVRVGCYYHDIGKTGNPEYFIENQQGENPHDELDQPRLSASILRAHVKRGLEKADEHNLPDEIKAFIEQHHGTTTMEYFYQEALKSDDDVSETSFQYPGPKPQSRETALCMIGDAVEAACRALDDPSPANIEKRVIEIVYDKFTNGQLDKCDLTLKELDTIIDSLTQSMTSIHHRRIDYPDFDDLPDMPDDQE